MRPRALDLFCGAGGASMGLHRAGFDVTGVDVRPQPRYPFTFVQGDALEHPLDGFDLVWASPPCQAFTSLAGMWNAKEHPNLIPQTRERLKAWGGPWVIENVPGSPLRVDLMLCGTMFGLATADGRAELRRHRWFESSFPLLLAPMCHHRMPIVIGVYGGHGRDRRRSTIAVYGTGNTNYRRGAVGVYGHAGGESHREKAQRFPTSSRREAMGIDWMTNDELSQAIPPAYGEHIGRAAIAARVPVGAGGP